MSLYKYIFDIPFFRAVQYYWFTDILQYFGFQYVLQYVFPYCNTYCVVFLLFPTCSSSIFFFRNQFIVINENLFLQQLSFKIYFIESKHMTFTVWLYIELRVCERPKTEWDIVVLNSKINVL